MAPSHRTPNKPPSGPGIIYYPETPRLRSPKGSSPRALGNVKESCLSSVLKHTRKVLVCVAILMIFNSQRPEAPTRVKAADSSHFLASTLWWNTSTTTKAKTKKETKESVNKVRRSSSNEKAVSLIDSYTPSSHPMFPKPKKIQVHFVADVSHAIEPPSKFLLDGLERSKYVEVIKVSFLTPEIKQVQVNARNTTRPLVWFIDWGSLHRDCHKLKRVLEKAHRKTNEYVLLADYSGSARQNQCDFFDERFRLAKRTIIEHRHYDLKARDVHHGSVAQNVGTPGGPTLHAPFPLREVAVPPMSTVADTKLFFTKQRPIDVSMFLKPGDYLHYSFWRRDVANVVQSFHSTYNTFVDLAFNEQDGMESGNFQEQYQVSMRASKIVVVAQRDEWEDHYRLMESLASGALVITDQITALPEGLENNVNVVVFDNKKTLQDLISYYMKNRKEREAIAKRGFELAMGQHRSWHAVERLLFGKPATHFSKPYDKPQKKSSRLETKVKWLDAA